MNIWDFEGQEISHQTHQFFLTSQSLYLLVFKCRDQFLMDRAEYWLDTIRARAPDTRVAIVITQCEQRTPDIPLDRLKAQYGDMLDGDWFFCVGCKNGSNVDKLQRHLIEQAARLEFMGAPWAASYDDAELLIKGQNIAHISRTKLNEIFEMAKVGEQSFNDAASAMSRLGVITQFPDCPDLADFVVLRPQWLTKAISRVMEDRKLSEDHGEIMLSRMSSICDDPQHRGMFATFHNCRKEFELCYDLEDSKDSCMVPLRFGYIRPAIPWSQTEGFKVRRVEYRLNIRPPKGIMSRFIVKTHHMIAIGPEQPNGVYWHNGVFLRSGQGLQASEALCEFVPEDRTLRIEVRAAFPQRMFGVIDAYINSVFAFFAGLDAERSYGCIRISDGKEAEQQCIGAHSEKRLYAAISRERQTIDCEFEDHEVDPRVLVGGFSSFNHYVEGRVTFATLREEFDRTPAWATSYVRDIAALSDWAEMHAVKLDQMLQQHSDVTAEFRQLASSMLEEYLSRMGDLLDDRDFTAAPGLIAVTTKNRSRWNPASYFRQTYSLIPYCEFEGGIHPCEDATVDFTKDQMWWTKTAPIVSSASKLLVAGLLLSYASVPILFGAATASLLKEHVEFMKELTKHFEMKPPDKRAQDGLDEVLQGDYDFRGDDIRQAKLARMALIRFLEEVAPTNYRSRLWGSLRRVRLSDNSHRWLCEEHAAVAR